MRSTKKSVRRGWIELSRRAIRRPFYESALEEIAKLHRVSAADSTEIRDDLPAQFDAALYLWEQHYFFENCLGRHFGVEERKLHELARLPRLEQIAQQLERYPRMLVHRDFQSQNIIIRDQQAYLIDFQGMRFGLAEYDLASLLYDPYVKVSAAERKKLLGFYRTEAGVTDPDFAEKFQFCAMQRLMQALGAYGFLGLVKGHKHFLKHVAAAMDSLQRVVAETDGLSELDKTLRQLK